MATPDLIADGHHNTRLEATSDDGASAKFKLPVTKKTGNATLLVSITYGYCRDGKGGLCKIDSLKFKVPVELSDSGEAKPVALEATPNRSNRHRRSTPRPRIMHRSVVHRVDVVLSQC